MSDFLDVLKETTFMFRKGEEIVEHEPKNGLAVTEVFAMPHESEAPGYLTMYDLVFIKVGVDHAAAERHRERILEELRAYPQPDRLAGGPSYIEFGAMVGSQDSALCFFALGAELGLWDLLTPMTFGIEGDEALDLAGQGMLMISGWKDAS